MISVCVWVHLCALSTNKCVYSIERHHLSVQNAINDKRQTLMQMLMQLMQERDKREHELKHRMVRRTHVSANSVLVHYMLGITRFAKWYTWTPYGMSLIALTFSDYLGLPILYIYPWYGLLFCFLQNLGMFVCILCVFVLCFRRKWKSRRRTHRATTGSCSTSDSWTASHKPWSIW